MSTAYPSILPTLGGETADFKCRHAEYKRRSPTWQYNEDHFAGGRVLRDKTDSNVDTISEGHTQTYLVRFRSELDRSWLSRWKRSAGLYHNLPEMALAAYTGQVYRQSPTRDLNPRLQTLAEDVDLQGTSADEFFQGVMEDAEMKGLSHVLVDAPRFDSVNLTEAVVRDLKLRPYFEHVKPEMLTDWSVERDDPRRYGLFNYVVIHDEFTRTVVPFKEPDCIQRYRVWTPNFWQVYEGVGEERPVLRRQGPNTLGEVPLVTFYAKRKKAMCGKTVFDDVCLKSNTLWNTASACDEAFYMQAFNQLVLVTDDKMGDMELGESRAIKLSLGSEAFYLNPSSVTFEAYANKVHEIVDQVADLIFVRTSRQLPTAQVESAAKRDLDRHEFLALLETKARSMQSGEKKAWGLAASFLNLDPGSVDVTYSREFRVTERTVDDWVKMVSQAVMSKVEWYRAEHPGVTEEAAQKAVNENEKSNTDRQAAAFSPFGFGDKPNADVGIVNPMDRMKPVDPSVKKPVKEIPSNA